jgi:putative transposase
MKHQFIDTHRRSYTVKALCQALKVSTSGYYAARSRPPSERSEHQTFLSSHIRAIHTASRYTYGAPRIHAELSARGVACSRNTVAKLMPSAASKPTRPDFCIVPIIEIKHQLLSILSDQLGQHMLRA